MIIDFWRFDSSFAFPGPRLHRYKARIREEGCRRTQTHGVGAWGLRVLGLGVALQRGFRGVGCQVLRVEAEGSWAWRVLLIGSFDAVVGRFAVPLVDMGGFSLL